VRFARRSDWNGSERLTAANPFSAINQKNAPPRESRNPLSQSWFEMRAAAPARQGK
jgi:hypothetical protein